MRNELAAVCLLLSAYWQGLSPQSFLELLLDHRKDSKKVANHPIGGYLEDGSLRVFIDGNDNI